MDTKNTIDSVLVGSSFSLGKIRRKVIFEPISIERARTIVASRPVVSFWGHENTKGVAIQLLGVDVTPRGGWMVRPEVTLSPEGFPMLYGIRFSECIVLSPNIDYRPTGAVSEDEIKGWVPLRLVWPEDGDAGGAT